MSTLSKSISPVDGQTVEGLANEFVSQEQGAFNRAVDAGVDLELHKKRMMTRYYDNTYRHGLDLKAKFQGVAGDAPTPDRVVTYLKDAKLMAPADAKKQALCQV